jgi:hypothetical protein
MKHRPENDIDLAEPNLGQGPHEEQAAIVEIDVRTVPFLAPTPESLNQHMILRPNLSRKSQELHYLEVHDHKQDQPRFLDCTLNLPRDL